MTAAIPSGIPVHWRSPSVLGKPALVITTGCHLPTENASGLPAAMGSANPVGPEAGAPSREAASLKREGIRLNGGPGRPSRRAATT